MVHWGLATNSCHAVRAVQQLPLWAADATWLDLENAYILTSQNNRARGIAATPTL